jgi:hypothetical protein
VVNDVRKAKKGDGLNAATNEIVDLVAAGIIDPAMVTRSALQNAASIAKNILTTDPASGKKQVLTLGKWRSTVTPVAVVAVVSSRPGGGSSGKEGVSSPIGRTLPWNKRKVKVLCPRLEGDRGRGNLRDLQC